MITIGEQVSKDLVETTQVCVIGSGAGGGAIAAELAEGGVEVVILEEGGYYTSKDFSADARAAIPQLYRDAGTSVILGTPAIIFSEGRCVGGSTVINGGMCWRTPERVLHRWQREFGLVDMTPEKMAPFFAKVEERINVAPQSPESLGKGDMLFKQAADKLGWLINHNRRNQKNCTGEGLCVFGCPTDRKQSVLITYIPRALAKGAKLYADTRAIKVKAENGRATEVVAEVLDRKTGKKKHTLRVKAKVIVLAGGALQTPSLLMGSGLAKKSGQVGKNFLCHPNVKVVGVFEDEVRYWAGVHQGHQIHEFLEEGILMAIGGVPPALVALGLPMHGRQSLETMELYNHMLVAGALVDDTTTGRIRRMPWGQPMAFYQVDQVEIERLIRASALLCEVLFTAGAKKCYLPFTYLQEIAGMDDIPKIYEAGIKPSEMEVLTVHALGTTRMGRDPRRSVVNGFCECHEVKNLFITDGGAIPTSLGVNPQETIMAVAIRAGQYLLENRARYMA
jgi:choline dehydrogenase-like flavoprotein